MLARSIQIVPLVLLMGTIFFLSHQPGNELQLINIPMFDKFAHGVAYGMLAAAALYAVPTELRRSRPKQTALWIILFCVAYGISDEYHQSFVPGRETSLGDLAADTVGAALVILLWLRLRSSGNIRRREAQ